MIRYDRFNKRANFSPVICLNWRCRQCGLRRNEVGACGTVQCPEYDWAEVQSNYLFSCDYPYDELLFIFN